MKRDPLAVIHKDNVEELLTRLGLIGDLRKGAITCHHCNKRVTLENFLAVAPKDNETIVVCDTPTCYESLLSESLSELS
jgi:hypothetical protein